MGMSEFARARDRLLAVADAPGSGDVCDAIVRAFHEIARFSGAAVMTTDPQTHLPSGGTVEGFAPEDCGPFWDNELADPDFNKFTELARRVDPVATLLDAVDGDLARSPRYVKLYSGLGAADELRVAFVAGSSCLAVGVFVRAEADGPFTAGELADVRRLLPVATRVVRQTFGTIQHETTTQPPVVVLLDADDRVTAMTAGGQQLLDDLRVNGVDGDLPGVVQVAARKARRRRAATNLTTRLRGRSGRWLRLHVSPVEGDADVVAVTVETARPDDLVRILLDSYGLTPRETEIVLQLCRGLSSKEIAADLSISTHTVRDHLKVIYTKADVTSRGELVASLFSNHILDRMHAGVSHLAAADVGHGAVAALSGSSAAATSARV